MKELLKEYFEGEANGAEVASVVINGAEAQITFKNSQSKHSRYKIKYWLALWAQWRLWFAGATVDSIVPRQPPFT